MADLLLRRGLRPVVVLIDAASFGGLFTSEQTAIALKSIGVPVCELSNGADLSYSLSIAFTSQNWF